MPVIEHEEQAAEESAPPGIVRHVADENTWITRPTPVTTSSIRSPGASSVIPP